MTNPVPEAYQGQRTLAAIVLTDAVGFSARMSVDEELTLKVIRRDQGLMESLCRQYEGRVVKSTGDGLLMFFSSAVQAVSCAIAIQHQLSQSGQHQAPNKTLLHRIGIHLGDVFCSQTDVMGNGVNIAARLQTEAKAGGICISQVVYDVVKSRLSFKANFAGPLNLKNIQEPIPAYHLDLGGSLPVVQADQEEQTEVEAAEDNPSPVPAPSRDRLDPESKVGGRYTIQRVLGQGGFGRSYLVKDTQRFGEFCVLKEFFPSNKSGRSLQKALDLFKREAKTLYQINHPQVPTFLACFTQGQRLFIVQEFIDGVTYSQLLRQRKREGRFFSEEEVTRWLMHMLQVLEHLHGLGIVHRDISPDNIIYSPERELPVLIDFGLVNDAVSDLLASSPEDITMTRLEPKAATMVGKFGYSPPEQMNLGQCYPCSDLYALGVTAIVLLTGRYPRELINRDSLEWQWQQHVRLSSELGAILDRMIRQKPRDRFQAARQVLDRIVDLVPNPASPLRPIKPAPIDLSPAENAAPLFEAPLQAGTPVSQDATFIEHCRQELTRCVGPIAGVLIEEALDQHPDAKPRELVEILASQLSNGEQATDFVSRLRWPDESPRDSVSDHGGASGSVSGDRVSGSRPGASHGSGAAPEALDPGFISRCRQELTRCVGPMADFILEETLAEYPHLSPQALIEYLSAEIPDPRKAQEFVRQME